VIPTTPGPSSTSPFARRGEEPAISFGADIPTASPSDIGPASAEHFAEVIAKAATILWNGPMGLRRRALRQWHEAVARAVAKSDAVSVVAAVTRWRRCKPLSRGRRQLRLDRGGPRSSWSNW